MKNNIDKIYDLEIIRYENNETLYILLSYEIDKENIYVENIHMEVGKNDDRTN